MSTRPRGPGAAVLVFFVVTLAETLPAQEPAGTWNVTWAQAVRYQGGEMQIQRWGDASLELESAGREVVGTWTTDVLETVRWSLEGTFSDGRLELVSTRHDSDNPELLVVEEMRWRGVVTGDRIEGEMTMVIRGRGGDLRWRPWSATRRGNR